MTEDQIKKIRVFLDQYPNKTIFLYNNKDKGDYHPVYTLLIGDNEVFKDIHWRYCSKEEAVAWRGALWLGVVGLKEHFGLKAHASVNNFPIYYKKL